jgi:hypothetical protein
VRPLLIGEANPYGGDPEFALYPAPPNCAGDRLCRKVMGLDPDDYLDRFDRTNLCPREWRAREARERASTIQIERKGGVLVLLGAKVTRAFGIFFVPFLVEQRGPVWPADDTCTTYVVLPHPSGLSRAWHAPGSFDMARETLRKAGVLPQ